MTDLQGQRVLVVGLGRSGLAAARFLARCGAVVMVSDRRPPATLAREARELMAQKIGVELGVHRESTFLRQDLIVVSPGVPADLPALDAARRKGIRIVPEVELASWFIESPIVGITGTNGKTTTTALTGAMLEASGFRTFVGGNIGVPLIQAAEQTPPPEVIVAELSSFQLEIIESFRATVAVLLNLSPNHLDRHPTYEAYARAKARIFEHQRSSDQAVLNADDPNVVKLANAIKSQKIFFSRQRSLTNGVFLAEGKLWHRVGHLERVLMERGDIRLRGEFNLENVMAAAAAALALGASLDAVRRAAREFQGVEHRLEFVREIAGVAFYNDSKATSVDAAAKALSTFASGVHLILGGKDKGAPYAPLRPLLKGRVREILLVGAAAEKIARELAGSTDLVPAGTIEAAVRRAFAQAEAGDTVLLSPACSSYDQYHDFEERGRAFKQSVSDLAEEYLQGRIRPRKIAEPDFLLRAPNTRPNDARQGIFKPPESATSLNRPSASPTDAEPPFETLTLDNGKPSSSARVSVPRELIYTYEVAAEEVAQGEEAGGALEADGEAVQDSAPSELGTTEEPEDEALSYEIRSDAARLTQPHRPAGRG